MIKFIYNRRNLFLIGLIAALAITLSEIAKGKDTNFLIFAQSTLDFWRGFSPYSAE